jgi:hypothetical protein
MSGMTKARDAMYMRSLILAGTTAAADIAVTDIATNDIIIFAGVFTASSSIASFADLTSECSVTSAGNIQFASTDTSGNDVWLIWEDTSGGNGKARDAMNYKFTVCDGHASAMTVTGIAVEDELIFCLEFINKASIATLVDRTSICTISAANTVAISSSTNASLMLIIWQDLSGTTTTRDSVCLHVDYLAGAGANTNIAVTGIKTTDSIACCMVFSTAANIATMLDRTSITSITSAGNIQLTSSSSTHGVLLFWYANDV